MVTRAGVFKTELARHAVNLNPRPNPSNINFRSLTLFARPFCSARQEHFARPLRWLRRLALGLRARVLPRSLLGKACSYLLDHWEPLTAHLRYSESRLDNNLVENAIRPSAIGKKNWLFIGHPDAGQRSAIIYSIVVSCQRHGKDPFAYLRDVLTRLPRMTNQDDLAALTPARWSAS